MLAGGGARGVAHIGAIEELESQGFEVHAVAGTSMGALVGGMYASGHLEPFKEWMYTLDKYKGFGLVDFAPIQEAAWIGLPNITTPTFSLNGILVIAPIALVVIVEHIGHLLTVTSVTGEQCNDKLASSLLGNGLGTMASGFLGGPALTSIAENIGVMGLSKCYSTRVFWWTAGFALIIGGFCPKLAMLFYSIPSPVLGGVSLMLFGLIAGNGLSLMVEAKVDFTSNRNLMIVASTLIVGVGMMTTSTSIPVGSFSVPGLLLASILAIVLNLVLPREECAEN